MKRRTVFFSYRHVHKNASNKDDYNKKLVQIEKKNEN